MKLAILIPTLENPQREKFLARLLARLNPQIAGRENVVGIFTLKDKGVETTGAKRQRLMESVDAEFVCHVDDDDLVADTYVDDILAAIDQGADVVGFKVKYYEDGVLSGYSVHSLAVERWGEQRQEDGFVHYTRTPNHLNPIRRELALQVGFKNMTVGEDADYARRMKEKFGATMNEVFIDKFLYQYFYRTGQPKVLIRMYEDDGTMTRAGMEKTIQDGGSVLVNGALCTKLEQLP